MGNFSRGKLVNLVNHELFTKIFTDTKVAICYISVAYLPNFSLPIAFTRVAHQKFPMYDMLIWFKYA